MSRTTDAIDKTALEKRSRGRSQTLLYNGRRPHQALADRTPMAVGAKASPAPLADNAVDMTLRLDDAAALPTCPPRQQQQTDASSGVIKRTEPAKLPIKNDGPVVPPMRSTSRVPLKYYGMFLFGNRDLLRKISSYVKRTRFIELAMHVDQWFDKMLSCPM